MGEECAFCVRAAHVPATCRPRSGHETFVAVGGGGAGSWRWRWPPAGINRETKLPNAILLI